MSRLRLRPVIEFDPFEYRGDRPSPAASIQADPAAWAAFWHASLADAGIVGLEPLPGTWVVLAADLTSPALLEQVLANHFGEPDVPTWLQTLPGPFDPRSGMNEDGERIVDGITALRGGFALTAEMAGATDGADVRIAPECCGDLANWREWQNAGRVTTGSWQEVWIGHPTARVRQVAGALEAEAVAESGEPAGVATRFAVADLHAAVAAARTQLEQLERRLVPILASALEAAPVTPPPVRPGDVDVLARGLAKHLAGLAEFHLD